MISKKQIGWMAVWTLGWVMAPFAGAEVKLHGLFTDNMVLQREAPITVWGWAAPGEEVRIGFDNSLTTTTTPASGQWKITLAPRRAGGPISMIVQGRNSIILTNLLVGEVWVASGQSNMEWPLRNSHEAGPAISNSANAMLRLYTVPKTKADQPRDNVSASWQVCGPDTVPGFSAVAYYFARDLQHALLVPVGIIHTSWGGSPAEVWMSEAALADNEDYQRDILDAHQGQYVRYLEAQVKWQQEKMAAEQKGEKFDKRAPRAPWKPTELYNGMIAPLIPYTIKGAIWYQGESNAGRAWQYRTLFADMIRNWRRDWSQGDFPFLLVQLAPFMDIQPEPGESAWAELREAQLLATQVLPKVGMAVITDVGEEKDIHPRQKEPVGARLALAARAIAYGEDLVYSGPVFNKLKVKHNEAILSFDHVGRGLEARGGELKGFAICGEDRKFVWGQAEIREDQVVVTSPAVIKPVAVRYGWANYPIGNLWNKNGLPATPFRTDDFPLTTQPQDDGTK